MGINMKPIVLSFRLCRRPFHTLNEVKTSFLLHSTLPMQVLQPSYRVGCSTSHYISDYADMSSIPIRSYSEVSDHRSQGISPNSSASSPSTGHSTTYGRSSKATSRSPPTRQRTPIRHHRPSISRVPGGAHSEARLAYAAQQESQANPSQNMASSQAAFPPSAYMMPPATSSYHVQSGYYSSSGMPQQQQGGQYMLANPSYSVEPNPPSYFLGRSASYPVETLPSMQASDSLYQPQVGANAPSQNWPSSSAAPHLPPMSLPSTISYSPSPGSSMNDTEGIRVLASRPKPQCFDHGCNGRQFSTFSNLLRHQREKSGSASKAICPHCGTEFTRTTARNGHLYGGKCKGRDGQGAQETEA
jgi:hypothetical protein